MSTKQEIWKLMEKINHIWLMEDPERLRSFIHKDIVVLTQDFKEQGRGIEAFINSYREFRKISKIKDFKVNNSRIDLFSNFAIVSYNFKIEYETNNEKNKNSGRDMFIFTKEDESWLPIWRMLFAS